MVLETALDQEVTEHLGHKRTGRSSNETGNVHNGTRSKTVLTESTRAYSRHRDIALLLRQTQDAGSLRYLVELEKARHPWFGSKGPGDDAESRGPRHTGVSLKQVAR